MQVIKRFNDKATKKRYEVGDIYNGGREKELEEKGYIAKLPSTQDTFKRSATSSRRSKKSEPEDQECVLGDSTAE